MPAYSVQRLAEEWGCSKSTIYTMIAEGQLKAFSIGRRGVRITEDEKLRVEQQTARPEVDPKDGEPAQLSTHALKMMVRR